MANIKFSAFTQKVVQTNVDFLVGYTGADNVRITPAALGDGIYLPLGGGTMVGDVTFNDNVDLYLGTGNDFQAYHDGSNTYLRNLNGDFIIKQDKVDADLIFQNDDGAGGTETYFYLDGSAGGPDPVTRWPDNSRIQLGTGGDGDLYHDGTDTYFYNSTGDLQIINYADDKDIIFASDDGAGGTTEYFRVDGLDNLNIFSVSTKFLDNVKVKIGTSSDLEIYHDGSNSYIQDTGTGNLLITSNGASVQINKGLTENMAEFIVDGAVNLYYDSAKKLESTATGIQVTDEVSIGTSLVHTGDTDTKVSFGTDEIVLTTAGADRMTVVSNGNIGIGNNNPNQSGLGIDHTVVTIGTATGMGMMELTGTRTSDADLGRIAWLNAATRRSEIVVSRIDEDTSTKMAFSTSNAGSMGTRMTIAKDGNVGIGTTTPSALLELSKSTNAGVGAELRLSNPHNSDNVNQIWFGHKNSGYAVSKIQSVGVLGGNNTQLKFQTEGASTIATRMTITQDGEVGIGTSSPTATLQVVGLVEYADNAAALLAGLTAGAFYRTGDLLKVVH